MRSPKSRIIIIVSSLAFVFIIMTLLWYFATKPRPESQSDTENRMQSESTIVGQINATEGGYVTEDGFSLSYMETEQIFSVTITKNPFEKNKAKALAWMKEHGLDPEKTSYLCFVTADIEVTEEQMNHCGTTNIQ